MSIIIKGMEMPTSCSQCPLHDEDYRGKEHCDIGWKMIGKAEEKPDWCPLIPVPPHGRLIDADALLSQYKGNIWTAQTDYAEGLRDVVKDIADAPTIIPVSEEGET